MKRVAFDPVLAHLFAVSRRGDGEAVSFFKTLADPEDEICRGIPRGGWLKERGLSGNRNDGYIPRDTVGTRWL